MELLRFSSSQMLTLIAASLPERSHSCDNPNDAAISRDRFGADDENEAFTGPALFTVLWLSGEEAKWRTLPHRAMPGLACLPFERREMFSHHVTPGRNPISSKCAMHGC